jgi:hypothetical protein
MHDLTTVIRDLINIPWKQARVYKNRPAWLKLLLHLLRPLPFLIGGAPAEAAHD